MYINGKLTFTYYDSKVIDDDMNTESKLVTTIADSVSKPVITDASVDYSEINAGKEAKADVSVTNNSFEPTGNLTFTVKNYDGTVLGTYTQQQINHSLQVQARRSAFRSHHPNRL